MPSLKISLFLGLLGAALPASAAIINNPGFENNAATFPGTAVNFAGGKAAFANSTQGTPVALPLDWSWAGSGGGAGSGNKERWVKSSAALQGQFYYYLSGSGTALAGNDDCLQVNITGLILGEIYVLSGWVAAAQTTAARAALEVQSGSGALQYKVFDLAANPAWSETALTVIPWQQVSMNFTAFSTTATMWISAQALTSLATSVVFDSLTIVAVPEPSTWTACGLGLLLLVRRRRPTQ